MTKDDLIYSMNMLDFGIADIAYRNGQELVAKKKADSDELVWWPIAQEGSGFERLFKGAIKRICRFGDR